MAKQKPDISKLKQEAADLFFSREKMQSELMRISQRLAEIGNQIEARKKEGS